MAIKYNSTRPTRVSGDATDLDVDQAGNAFVTQGTLMAGEDLTISGGGVQKVEQRFQYTTITTAATTVVRTGAGFLHSVTVLGGTLGAITAYDNSAASGTLILPTFTPTAAVPCPPIVVNTTFSTGLTIVTAAATVLLLAWRTTP